VAGDHEKLVGPVAEPLGTDAVGLWLGVVSEDHLTRQDTVPAKPIAGDTSISSYVLKMVKETTTYLVLSRANAGGHPPRSQGHATCASCSHGRPLSKQ
jgi:hypothetical protein